METGSPEGKRRARMCPLGVFEPRLKHTSLNSKRRWCVSWSSKHFEISTPICISDWKKSKKITKKTESSLAAARGWGWR